MTPMYPSADDTAVRLAFRSLSRLVLRRPRDAAAHAARLRVALQMPGAEPAQGALADWLVACPDAPLAQRRETLAALRARLGSALAQAFAVHVEGRRLPPANPLATRWSVLAAASLDVPPRALRGNSDDSRLLAAAALRAWRQGDMAAQQAFLDHCRVCHDTLAFLLARREILRNGLPLPAAWQATQHAMQPRQAHPHRPAA
ncbi:hypothetical protein [Aquabacterium sp. OR-4]|uniref:hypothetical protein n=1 Tax=Aquabacterium sp. OR-4 TaxID=2978127 RepID=UPI0021B30AFF|nr:hypothetical protein [Aquabacterium sp. OR-4]MDT7837707.1 hypothetical protein [Aquabacterium sp. OR-4]